MNETHIEKAKNWESLGPTYFSAQEFAETFMQGFEAEQFKPLLKKFTDAFTDEMWGKMETFLISDTQANIQSHVWRDVDAVVEALLGGNQWALQKYVMPDRFDAKQIREAVAKLIPAELQEKRVADLEEEVRRLKEDLKYYRETR